MSAKRTVRPLRQSLAQLDRVITASIQRNHPTERAQNTDAYTEAAVVALDNIGALDVLALSTTELIQWLGRIDQWPSGMPHPDNPTVLGLDEANLAEAVTEQEKAREGKIRAERQLSVHGTVLNLGGAMSDLITMVETNLAKHPPSLDTPTARATSKSSTTRPSGGVARTPAQAARHGQPACRTHSATQSDSSAR